MATFDIKRDATKPFLAVQLLDNNGSAIDLTSTTQIYFRLATNNNSYTPVFSGTCNITGSTTGNLEYRWTASNTARSGLYLGEFEATFTDSSKLVLPSNHSLRVNIYEDYNGS